MNSKQKIFFILVLIGSLIIRLHNYDKYPQRGATSDEYSYSFLGISLLTKGVPISWSPFTPYKHRFDLTIRKIYFPMAYPYFDHPPLNGILVGAWALLHNENSYEKIQLSTIRIIPIVLSFITSILLFYLTLHLFDYKTALWSLLIYSTTTIFVMNGRVVLAENLLSTIFIGAVYLYKKWYTHLTILHVVVLAILSGLGFWAKELGIVVGITMVFYLLKDKIQFSKIIIFTGVALGICFFYIAYGAYYDADVFWKIIGIQSGRNVGIQTLYYIISTPIIINKVFYDGWYYVGFLSLGYILIDYKKNNVISIPAAIYTVLLLFFLTQNGEMGWYIIPLFPFMAMATGRMFVDAVSEKSMLILLPTIFLGQYYMSEIFEKNFGLAPVQFRIFLMLLLLPIFISFIWSPRKYPIVSTLYFYIFIICNAYISFTYIHPA